MRITPGFVTGSAARALNRAVRETEANRGKLQQIARSLPDEFPAKITSYDGATGRCGWTMRSYGATGLRIDHENGVTGSITWMPAYPVGNGLMPPPAFPVDVWMRKRLHTGTLGPVFEFDWVCGCTASGSGSGGSGATGGVETDCCPSANVPNTLFATITVTAGTCTELNGQVVTLIYDAGITQWTGTVASGGETFSVLLECANNGRWQMEVVGTVNTDNAWDAVSADADSCDPFSVTFDGMAASPPNDICPGSTLSVTVTE